ncbi:hypothetical protein [Candidatus Tisiphia endosymbiont of Myopa tessellatipennis]|uniref:hypothetical protein n=1 Tax=Candidatus Tisiphia endosymbiont of Myopa tessellatipennis TaxID=3066257 RepID=UPI00313D2638
MSKNQEDNATSTSEETMDEKRKKFLDSLENSRTELKEKSVEEIKKLSTLELAKYFCDVHLLIKHYQEYNQIYSDSSITSEELKHNVYIYLNEHTKPDIGKFITVFDTLKARVSQLQQCDQNSSQTKFNILWTTPMTSSLNKLQKLDPKNIENMINDETMQDILVGFRQLLDSPSLKDPLMVRERIIASKDAVANLTEEDKTAIAASEEKLRVQVTSLQLSYCIDSFIENTNTLRQLGEDTSQVPTTGSSNLGDDDLA